MTFPVDDIYLGAPTYGKRGSRGEAYGIIWHTTESADASRASALATAKWQATPGTTTGSYNFIIYDGGILLTVPYLEASGGVNPGSASWAPERYPFLKTSMPDAAYQNPNEYLLNVAFSGKTAVFRAGGMPANMIDTAAKLTLWVQSQDWGKDAKAHSGHMHWQTNRSDPSQVVLDRIAARIKELTIPVVDTRVFTDIEDSFAKDAILRATEAGIFSKPADKLFRPKEPATREQLAAVVDRILTKTGAYNG